KIDLKKFQSYTKKHLKVLMLFLVTGSLDKIIGSNGNHLYFFIRFMIIQWMGYDTAYVPIEHNSRRHGKSSYSIKKLITLGTDVLISQSNKPLRFSIQFGFLISLISFIYGAYLFTRYFFLSEPVQGW